MRRAALSGQTHETVVHISSKFRHGAIENGASTIPVVTKNESKARDDQLDFFVFEVSARSRAKCRDTFGIEGVEIMAAMVRAYAP
jgi:hypothetical protein